MARACVRGRARGQEEAYQETTPNDSDDERPCTTRFRTPPKTTTTVEHNYYFVRRGARRHFLLLQITSLEVFRWLYFFAAWPVFWYTSLAAKWALFKLAEVVYFR